MQTVECVHLIRIQTHEAQLRKGDGHKAYMAICIDMHVSTTSCCRDALKLSPKHLRALKLLGSALYAQGDLQGACTALQSALHLNPSYADAHCDLGCALCALGEVAQAKEAFASAAHLNPRHVEVSCVLMSLVIAAACMADFQQALAGCARRCARPSSHASLHQLNHELVGISGCPQCCRLCSTWAIFIARAASTKQLCSVTMLC